METERESPSGAKTVAERTASAARVESQGSVRRILLGIVFPVNPACWLAAQPNILERVEEMHIPGGWSIRRT